MALLRVDPGLVIWLWITFGIILLILRFTAWPDHRRSGQEVAEDRLGHRVRAPARGEGKRRAGRVRRHDPRGKTEAANIIEDARTEAARLREEMLEKSWAEVREAEGTGRPGNREGP